MNSQASLKTALVHHWLVTRRGGERVLDALLELFPQADLFTLVCDRENLPPCYSGKRIRTSFIQRLPAATRWYPHYLPLFPWATERLNLTGYDLVICSDAATLKGVRADPGTRVLCYCHTPMRYVWSGYQEYRRSAGPLARLAFVPLASWLRRWDFEAAQRVTSFVANSRNVAARIRTYYGRESAVIYPPVDTDYFAPPAQYGDAGNYFLVVSHLVPYKRVDLVVEAFNRCGSPLLVVGEGAERRPLERRARPNIRFLGSQPDGIVRRAMQQCRALVFAGDEDFGLVMAEAQACGKPVIAFARGGAREIIADGQSGLLFEEQSTSSLLDTLARFERVSFDPLFIRSSALRFSRTRFLKEFRGFVTNSIEPRRLSPELVPFEREFPAGVPGQVP